MQRLCRNNGCCEFFKRCSWNVLWINFASWRLAREDFERKCFWKLNKYSCQYANSSLFIQAWRTKIFHVESHVSVMKYFNHLFIFFCLFHRLNYLICYIPDFFLPSRKQKFGDNVPNCVEWNKHCIYIFVIYSKQKKRMRSTDSSQKASKLWKISATWAWNVHWQETRQSGNTRSCFYEMKMKLWIFKC